MIRIRLGLQGRLVLVLILVLAVVAAVLAGLWWQLRESHREFVDLAERSLHDSAIEALHLRGREQTRLARERLVNPLYYFDLEGIGEILRELLRQPDVVFARVLDPDGGLVHDGGDDLSAFGRKPEAVSSAPNGQGDDAGLLRLSEPIALAGQPMGSVEVGLSPSRAIAQQRVSVAALQAEIDRSGRDNLRVQLGLLAVLALLGAVLLVLVGRGLVQPIRRLAEAARLIEAGHHDEVELSSRRRDELGELNRAFARMAQGVALQERQMRTLAYSDSLTGLPNRLSFRETLEQRIRAIEARQGRMALLFLDLDDFKRVNDSLGHDAGDELLVQFSTRLTSLAAEVGGASAVASRFGGDEFVLLVEGEDLEHRCEQMVLAIRRLLGEPFRVGGRGVVLSASIGIALFPRDAADAGALLRHVDIAMYQAKHAGKNTHRFFTAGMDRKIELHAQLEQELRGAWQRGEMFVAYQPIFRLNDRVPVAVEALLRWRHPLLGMVAPSEFIPIAERSGQIGVIGARMLAQACSDAKDWRASGRALTLSVNVSSFQLRDGELIEQVSAALAVTSLPAARLHLELTETAVLTDEEQAAQTLSAIRARGVGLWLDDFGTSFSGLSHLRRVPFDGIKIDRSFVADLLADPEDMTLAASIIGMAHGRGITVIAEGIELEEQLEVLRRQGCDLGQGSWLAAPMTAAQMVAFLDGLQVAPPTGSAPTPDPR